MTINASETVKTLKGEAYQSEGADLTIGAVIAEALAVDQTPGKMKLYVLAKKFYDGGKVEIDSADATLVKKAVENCKSYNNLILGAVLEALEG